MLRRYIDASELKLDSKPKIYIPVLGKTPKPTDSGNYISRILRNDLKVSESNIKSYRDSISIIGSHNIIICDDILGTGNQLANTLRYEDFTL